ncbi:hypothetical protein [Aquimarina sp. AU58]|uniref:hypothetical protein n=1 Tax=Aquimarina sp. AU58 TaxID=1874112 RepID=UPI000D6E5197|nr:hypothetical protein [Aquimarina sp. AU58]
MKIKLSFFTICFVLSFACSNDDNSQQVINEATLDIVHNNKIIFDAGFLISKATAVITNDIYQNTFDFNIDHVTHIFNGTLTKIPYGEYKLEVRFYENDKVQFYANASIILEDSKKTIDDLVFKEVDNNEAEPLITNQFLSVHINKDLTITLGPDRDKDGNSITYTVTPEENFTRTSENNIVYNNGTIGKYILNVTAKEKDNTETKANITISIKEPVFLEAPADILFVGNSLTHPFGPRWGDDSESKKGAVKYHLQQIYNELNLNNGFVESIRGGASLKRHYGYDNPPNPDSPGDTYEIDAIKEQHTVTVLQPMLDEPSDHLEDFRAYGKIFIDLIRDEKSIPVIYHPWSLKNRQDTYETNLKETKKLCNELGIQFVDVASVVYQIYLDDTTTDKALYNRLYAGNSDNTHLSIEGMYMVGLSFAKFFTGVDATDINYRVEEADKEYADMIKSTIDKVISNRFQE